MHFFLDGLFSKEGFSSFQFIGKIKNAAIASFSFESKFLTTQFNYVDFICLHQQQIPIIKFDVTTTEFTGNISFKSKYYLNRDKTIFQFNGIYNINKYKDYDFIGKTSSVQQNSFKLISKYKKNTYNYLRFKSRYYTNRVVNFYYRNKYVAYKKNNLTENRLSFQGVYTRTSAYISIIGGLYANIIFSTGQMKAIDKTLFKMSNFIISNKKNIQAEIFIGGHFNCQVYTKQAGFESVLFPFKILDTQYVGGMFPLELGSFKAKHIPIGGLWNGYHKFLLKRNINDYHYQEDSFLNKKVNFINVPIKNPVYTLDAPDIQLIKSFLVFDLFKFHKKVEEIFYTDSFKTNNSFLFLEKFFYHHINELSIIIKPIINKNEQIVELFSKIENAFMVQAIAKKRYQIKDFSNLNFNINIPKLKLTEKLYPLLIDTNIIEFNLKQEKLFRINYESEKDIYLYCNFYITKNISLFNTSDGASFTFSPHKKMYTSSNFTIVNSFITSSKQTNKTINFENYFMGSFSCYKNIGGFFSENMELNIYTKKITTINLIQSIIVLEIQNNISISSFYNECSFKYINSHNNTILETKWNATFSVCKILIPNNLFVCTELKVKNEI